MRSPCADLDAVGYVCRNSESVRGVCVCASVLLRILSSLALTFTAVHIFETVTTTVSVDSIYKPFDSEVVGSKSLTK